MGAEAGDACRQGDAAASMLESERTGEEAPAALISGRKEAVDGTVHLSGGTIGLLLAGQALASVRDLPPFLVGHTP